MKKPTLQEAAYRAIAFRIAEGAYAPGQWLREQHLSEELGISATPVREAFRRLEREGWIEFVPRRGCRMRVLTIEEIEDLYLMREGIEVVSIRRAVARATDEDWRTIASAVDRFEDDCREAIVSAADRSAIDAPVESDLAFHVSLVAATHSERIIQSVRTANLQAHTMVASRHCPLGERQLLVTAAEHRAIYQAMHTGQVRAAEELLRAHIVDAGQRMVAALARTEADVGGRPSQIV